MTAWLLLLTTLAVLPDGLSADDVVRMEDGIAFAGVVSPTEATPGGGAVELALYFQMDKKPAGDVHSFVHIESSGGGGCRAVRDTRLGEPVDGVVEQRVQVTLPAGERCAVGERLEVYVGLYNRTTGARVEVVEPPSPADRIHAGWLDLEAEASPETQAIRPSEMAWEAIFGALSAWKGWGGGLLLAMLLALALGGWAWRRGDGALDDAAPEPLDGWKGKAALGASLLVLAGPAVAGVLAALDFVKDDAYISFRYAQNLVAGRGLVFNEGERLEGFTNFFWVLLMAPFEALDLDLFQVCEVLGLVMTVALVVMVARLAWELAGPGYGRSHLWGGVWLATSSGMALWATSGLAPPLAMLLPVVSAWLLWRREGWRGGEGEDLEPLEALGSGVLMGLGCLTRPEVHLIGIIVGLPLVWRAVAARRLERPVLLWFVGLLGVTAPAHLFRWTYYGSLAPNTFFVKTGGGQALLLAGIAKLREMFGFNTIGALALLAPLAFVDRRRWVEKLCAAAVAVGFMAYVVKVGVDEMRWHRLYLPALPFLALLAGLGLQNLVRLIRARIPMEAGRVAVTVAGWAVVLVAAWSNLSFTITDARGFNGWGELSGNFHPDLGKFVTRHGRPGELVAFQDMGSTPYHAPDMRFLDFIGLVDGTVAQARDRYGLHAYLPTGSRSRREAYNEEMRSYFHSRAPEWAILTTYVPGGQARAVGQRFAKDPSPTALRPYVARNRYQFGIYDATFRERYVHVRTWPRSATYYLSLFQRRDLAEQEPGEVVLDAPPQELGGVTAEFERGLKLLGTRIEPTETIERHEVFVTMWFEVPGPMEADIMIFTHVERPGVRHPYDAMPGDWVYPADRWKPGQIVEHRALVQLPPHLGPGSYEIHTGLYRRSTGARLTVERGEHDGQNRLKLGSVRIRAWRPFLDHIIPKTDLEVMRKHPERIRGAK